MEFADSRGFGSSDTSLVAYRAPEPLPVPVSEQDLPYVGVPTTVEPLYFVGRDLVYGIQDPTTISYTASGNMVNTKAQATITDYALEYGIKDRQEDRRYVKSVDKFGARVYYTDADIREMNAEVIGAMLLEGKESTVKGLIAEKKIDRPMVDRAIDLLPYLQERRAQSSETIYSRKLAALIDSQGMGPLDVFMPLAAGVLMAVPGGQVFGAVMMAGWVLGTTIPKQIETGKATVDTVIGQVLAVLPAIEQGASAYQTSQAAKVAASVSDETLQASQFAKVTPTETLQVARMGLAPYKFNAHIASLGFAQVPDEMVGMQLGVTRANLLTQAPSLTQQTVRYVEKNPGVLVEVAEFGKSTYERVESGDIAGIFGDIASRAGINVGPVNQPDVPYFAPRNIVKPSIRTGGELGGGSSMYPSDSMPHEKNLVPYVVGAVLFLIVLYGLLKKG